MKRYKNFNEDETTQYNRNSEKYFTLIEYIKFNENVKDIAWAWGAEEDTCIVRKLPCVNTCSEVSKDFVACFESRH